MGRLEETNVSPDLRVPLPMVPARHRSGCEKGRPGEKAAPLSIVRVPHPGQPYRYSIPTGAVLIRPAENLIGAESVQERPQTRGVPGGLRHTTRIGKTAIQWLRLRPRSHPDVRIPMMSAGHSD